MGYDCTLHVVDPGSIERFVDHFLGRTSEPTRFDTEYDAPTLYAKIRDEIARDPRAGGRYLLHALLFFVSTETPHLPSRGFALGLWDRFVAEPIPVELQPGDSLAGPLGEIVERHPTLQGKLWTGFVGNYEVGAYVPPERVPALLAFVKQEVAHVKPSEEHIFEPVLRVLKVAKRRKLGYWEATDLDVCQANAAWLKKRKPRPAKPKLATVPIALDIADLPLACGDRLVLSSVSSWATCFVDTSQDPPAVVRRERPFVWNADVTAGGRAFGLMTRPGEDNILAEIDLAAGELRPLPCEGRRPDLDDLRCIGERVLVAPLLGLGSEGRTPAWYEEGRLRPLELPTPPGGWDKPRTETGRREGSGWSVGAFDALTLGGDRGLLIWGGWLYRLEGETATLLPPGDLCGPGAVSMPPQRVVESERSALWVDHETLVTLDLEGNRTVVSPVLDDVLELRPGPDRAVVVKQLDNLEGDILKVVWRGSDEVTRISRKLLGEKQLPRAFAYVPTRAALALLYFGDRDSRLCFLPWSEVEALPRCTFAEIEAEREAVRAKKQARRRS